MNYTRSPPAPPRRPRPPSPLPRKSRRREETRDSLDGAGPQESQLAQLDLTDVADPPDHAELVSTALAHAVLLGYSIAGAEEVATQQAAYLARELTRIACNVPLPDHASGLERRRPDLAALEEFYDEAGFGTALRRQAARFDDERGAFVGVDRRQRRREVGARFGRSRAGGRAQMRKIERRAQMKRMRALRARHGDRCGPAHATARAGDQPRLSRKRARHATGALKLSA